MYKEVNNPNGYTPCVSTGSEENILLTINGKSIISKDRRVRVDNVCQILELNFDDQLHKLRSWPLFNRELYDFMNWDGDTGEPIWTLQDTLFWHWILLISSDLPEIHEIQDKCFRAIYEVVISNQ